MKFMSPSLETLNDQVLACRQCPRLVAWREKMAREKRKAYQNQEYWGKPVPGFGDAQARVFVVGLAPGAHGSNRTGRQFTGDASGSFFYPALHRAGFANRPESVARDDGLVLTDLYTAPVCRCAPPDNKPNADEMSNCQPFLEAELRLLRPQVIVVLGRIAFDSLARIVFANPNPGPPTTVRRPASMVFAHGAVYPLPPSDFSAPTSFLLCSYHPSQQNTLTGRLTIEMFDSIWRTARELVESQAA